MGCRTLGKTWIDVNVAKPPLFRKVLVWIQPPGVDGMFDIGAMSSKYAWYIVENKHVSSYVTHWIPVNEP